MKHFLALHKTTFIYLACSWLLILLLLILSRSGLGFGEFYAVKIFPFFPNTVGRLMSVFSFSVFEMLVYFTIAYLVFVLVRFLLRLIRGGKAGERRKRVTRGLLHLACLLTALFSMFVLTCGINYGRDGFARDAGLITAPASGDALSDLCLLLISDLEATTGEIPLDQEGHFAMERDQMHLEAKRAMKRLGETYPTLSGYYPNPKPILLSASMSDLNLTGIYSPFTLEANYNQDTPGYGIPFTICHGLAHLKGYAREEDAGFIGYLACSGSASPGLRYSGALSALSYALTALYENVSLEEYREVISQVPQQAMADLRYRQEYWDRHRGPATRISQAANDTYLKANAQADGVKSYGRMVDLLIAYYHLGDTQV